MTRLVAIVAALVIAIGLGAMWVMTMGREAGDQFAQCRTSQIAGGSSQIGGPFELVNAQGETVTDKDVITGPSLLYFGYTFCPDVCPLDVSRNAETIDVLDERGQTVTPVFISIDPKRDTPELVGEFASNVIKRGSIDALVMGQCQEPDARSEASAQQAYISIPPMPQPLNSQSYFDDGTTHRLKGQP